ncbi:hypothetical protein GCM10017554_11770 [Acinetobacter modestus]|nr:hypothetical protein GCM10017554_11770 [Acinetobacter modestus]
MLGTMDNGYFHLAAFAESVNPLTINLYNHEMKGLYIARARSEKKIICTEKVVLY